MTHPTRIYSSGGSWLDIGDGKAPMADPESKSVQFQWHGFYKRWKEHQRS